MGFRFQGFRGLGFRVQGLGFRVQGLGFRVQGLGFRVQGLGFRVQGLGFGVQASRVQRCTASGLQALRLWALKSLGARFQLMDICSQPCTLNPNPSTVFG